MLAKAISTLTTLTNTGTNALLERGKLIIEQGKVLRNIVCKVTIPLANASGGSVTLSDTQRQSFLAGLSLTLSYGKGNKRLPYNKMLWTRMQRISRFLVGQDWEGYANSSTGLARALPNSATTNVTFWLNIPTSYIWHNRNIRKVLGVGPTQAKTMQLEFFRNTDTLPSGVTVSSGPIIAIYPDVEDGPDQWVYLAEWYESDETDKVARIPKGLPIYGEEDTAVLVSTALTNLELKVGKKVIFTQQDPNTAYIPVLQLPNIPAEADVSDRETTLYQWTQQQDFAQLPVGQLSVEQITKDLGTFKLRGLVFPIPADDEVRADIEEAAGKTGRNTPLKAVNTAVVQSYELPEAHHAYVGFTLFSEKDPEFSRYAGMVSMGDGDKTSPYVPQSVHDNARGLIASYKLKGEERSAEGVIRHVALACPGAVQDTEGFDERGSPVLDQVRAALEA